MRTDAAKRGLDPDKWFDNVEVVVARRIGIETTTYEPQVLLQTATAPIHR